MSSNYKNQGRLIEILILFTLVGALGLLAQEGDEETYELSPFVVESSDQEGYTATSTLAGTRIKTDLADLGSAISVVTQEFLEDTGATGLGTLLSYTTNTEVGGDQGNFSDARDIANSRYYQKEERTDPQLNTRIRGLGRADLTRGLFLTDIGFDSYNTERVTVSRGPNSLLFGIGSPGGVIDASLKQAVHNANFGEVKVRVDNYGTFRSEFDVNRTLVEDRLAIRVAALRNDARYKQEEAWTRDERIYANLELVLFKNENSDFLGPTRIRANGEVGTTRESPIEVIPPTVAYSGWFEPVPSSIQQFTGIAPPANVVHPNEGGTWEFQETYNPLPFSRNESQINTNVHPAYFRFIAAHFNDPNATTADVGTGDGLQGYQGVITWRTNLDTLDSTGLAGTPGAIAAFGPDAPGDTPVNRTSEFHAQSPFGEPFAIGFAAPTLRNRDVFDYRNHIYSGGIDNLERKFDAYSVTLEQGFFDNKLAVEATFDKQHYETTQDFFFQGGRDQSTSGTYDINVSIAEYLQNGQPNPNLGRAYSRVAIPEIDFKELDRETVRLTMFGELDFSEKENWLQHLGRHRFTALYNDHTFDRRSSQWEHAWVSNDFNVIDAVQGNTLTANRRGFTTVVWTSDSLLGLSSINDVRLNKVNIPHPQPGDSYQVLYADTSSASAERTLRTGTVTNERFLDEMNISQTQIEAKAFAWQSYFLDNHIVGLLGYREDDTVSFNRAIVGEVGFEERDEEGRWKPEFTRLSNTPALEESGDTRTWSVVGRYPEALLGDLPGNLDLQVHYAESENFNPIGFRNDALGRPLGQPTATTKEYGFLIKTIDNKLNFKVNWFETSLNDQNAPPRVNTLSYALNRINDYRDAEINLELPFSDQFETISGDPTSFPIQDYDTFYSSMLNAIPAELRDISNIRQVDVTGDGVWDSMEADSVQNLRSTQDRIAKGVEFEVVANPTINWRLILNVSQQETINSNTASVMGPVVEAYTANLRSSRLGELRMSAGGTTVLRPIEELWLSQNVAVLRAATALDDTVSNEQREWRFNGVTSYSFTEGWLDGLNVGGSIRWEDEVATGYVFALDPEAGVPIPLVDQPHMSDSLLHGDLFASYRWKLTDKIDWKIQLNIRNAFGDDDDIPVKTNPDGQVAVIRIPNPRTIMITNTFSF
ncbi:MAG: TonB-dependent receptor plug domain-containing protein [Opitutae bacterium]|nr:TonB-dependent receptor plug domain-containing protein [Opitutae bacterium]MBC9888263.1 TonB-dependent receptor plug domain-containing protein [Opitutae bacterium]